MTHHSSLISLLAGAVEIAGLFLLTTFPSYRTALLFLLGAIVVFVSLLWWHTKRHGRRIRADHLIFVVATVIASGALVSVIEWKPLTVALIFLFGLLIGLVFRLIDHMEGVHLSYQVKPFRRMVVMIWVFDVYAISTVLFALALFFPNISRWIFVLASSLVYAGASFVMWRLYMPEPVLFYRWWIGIVFLVLFEIVAVLHTLPFGYAASGLIATWMWYLLHLFARFHLDRSGIVWKKQRWFLAVNVALFAALLLFVIRWI